MPVQRFEDGTILVTGDSIRAVASMVRFRHWHNNAGWVVNHKGRPSTGMSVARFNSEYDMPEGSVRTWADVLRVTTDTLAEIANQRKGDVS